MEKLCCYSQKGIDRSVYYIKILYRYQLLQYTDSAVAREAASGKTDSAPGLEIIQYNRVAKSDRITPPFFKNSSNLLLQKVEMNTAVLEWMMTMYSLVMVLLRE